MRKFLCLPFFLLIFYHCNNTEDKNNGQNNTANITSNKYAKGFNIKKLNDDNYLITISNPWQEVENIHYDYFFSKQKNASHSNSSQIIFPLNRVMCLSTTHIAFIEKLNATDKIIGISNPHLAFSEKVRKRFEAGLIADIGFDQSLNFETIINAKPDLIFIYGVGGENAQFYNKLNELGLNTIFIGEYLEENPLAKLEWIKLFGLLFNEEALANQIFLETENEYLALLHRIPENENSPTVLFNLPWKGTWFVPGGNSYLAQMIKLCKGKYLWEDNNSRSTIPLSVESVIVKGSEAEIWLNPGNAKTKDDILLEDSRLESFPPFINGRIYNFNKRINENGGNDYWESGVVNPHLILKDLIAILHPDAIPNHEFYYYRQVE